MGVNSSYANMNRSSLVSWPIADEYFFAYPDKLVRVTQKNKQVNKRKEE